MKIIFDKVRYKNLLSCGNSFTEIDLQKNISTLIIGENGAGKSTILDALCFGLFGRPYRKINKPDLVNSINQKDLLVEVEFTIGKREYLIRRGIKPNVFEIHQDGNMISQSATVKDYQKYIENNIIKLNFRSFTQIVILGSSSFIPFMQLSAAHRREIIEDLLDIKIFSYMNTLLKEHVSTNRESLRENEYHIELINEKISLQSEHMDDLREDKENQIEKFQQEIKKLNESIKETNLKIDKLRLREHNLLQKTKNENRTKDDLSKLQELEVDMNRKMKDFREHFKFFKDNDKCPTCDQYLEENFKDKMISVYQQKIDKIQKGLDQIQSKFEKYTQQLTKYSAIRSKINDIVDAIGELNVKISGWNAIIGKYNSEIQRVSFSKEDMTKENKKLKGFMRELIQNQKDRKGMIEKRELYDVAMNILKDTGIKTQIIKQYIPIINKLINKYLAALDFFVAFELDENFTEVIKSRHRDSFSYENFSEGEKLRIDLSLLFTWRSVAKLKNSVNTNLLILDEIFDASLDSSGCEEFMKLLQSMDDNTNIFIISHKPDELNDKFNNVLRFEKVKNFSHMIEGEN